MAGVSVLRRSLVCLWTHKVPNRIHWKAGKLIHSYCTISAKPNCLSVCRNELIRHSAVKYTTEASAVTPVFLQAEKFSNRTAIVSQRGTYEYEDLLHYSSALSHEFNILFKDNTQTYDFDKDSRYPLAGERIAFLCDNDLSYVVTQWAIWMCGAIAVPLYKSHPTDLLKYFAEDSGAKLLVCSDQYVEQLEPVSVDLGVQLKVLHTDDFSGDYDEEASRWSSTNVERFLRDSLAAKLNNDEFRHQKALIVYTSGTTGKPKGVVHTFGSLDAQIRGMVSSWKWTKNDVILHTLPLHHVHGIVNVLMTPLYVGATCVMQSFEAESVWKSLLREDPNINVFMAVPTMYAKLIEEYEKQLHSEHSYLPRDLKDILTNKFRLMVSGSAALPESVMRRWAEITGHTLLERYGMTEVGMALTNPLHGQRLPGSVGLPFPGVSVTVVHHDKTGSKHTQLVTADCDTVEVTPGHENESGELLVKGDNLFTEYWNKPEATAESFTDDGWFQTGDTAMYSFGTFKIVGRTSVDVIKSGGYKISALEIERHLLEHPSIKDVAVIGLPDNTWGEIVTAVVSLNPDDNLTLEEIHEWGKNRLPSYNLPKMLEFVPEIPRNAMGKVNKKELAKSFFPDYFKS